jgi:hypothetical protein
VELTSASPRRWILIKRMDMAARPGSDITSERPEACAAAGPGRTWPAQAGHAQAWKRRRPGRSALASAGPTGRCLSGERGRPGCAQGWRDENRARTSPPSARKRAQRPDLAGPGPLRLAPLRPRDCVGLAGAPWLRPGPRPAVSAANEDGRDVPRAGVTRTGRGPGRGR